MTFKVSSRCDPNSHIHLILRSQQNLTIAPQRKSPWTPSSGSGSGSLQTPPSRSRPTPSYPRRLPSTSSSRSPARRSLTQLFYSSMKSVSRTGKNFEDSSNSDHSCPLWKKSKTSFSLQVDLPVLNDLKGECIESYLKTYIS